MKKINVMTAYDTNRTVIGRVMPKRINGNLCISKRTYKRLLNQRTIGGDAGLIFDCPETVYVYDEKYNTFA